MLFRNEDNLSGGAGQLNEISQYFYEKDTK